jgi:hypothetical protein
MELLLGAIDPDSWEDQDGSGSVRILDTGGVHALAVYQTPRAHTEIVSLLAELRQVRHPSDGVIQTKSAGHERLPRLKRTGAFQSPLVDSRTSAMARGVNLFGIELYSKLARETDGNVLISPMSLSFGMALVSAGAREKTADEIAHALHFLLRGKDLPRAYLSLWGYARGFHCFGKIGMTDPGHLSWMSPHGQGSKMEAVNLLWLQEGTDIREQFREDARVEFSYEGLAGVDFAARDGAAAKINELCKRTTGRMIPTIVTAGDLSESSRFIVTNALTF